MHTYIISYHIIIIQVHHVQSHTRANCPMQHVYVNIYNFSALCGFCLHVSHTMVHNQVYSACSVCVLARSVMTFNLFSRLYLHCSTKRLLGQLPKYIVLGTNSIHFDTFRYFRYVTLCCVTLYVCTVSTLHYCTTY